MATININGSALGNSLNALLTSQEIEPGDAPSYQLCKTIYAYHPLGAKIAESPIAMAQSQEREISVADGPEDDVVDAFKSEWKGIGADKHIFNTMVLARVYGVASVAALTKGVPNDRPLDFKTMWEAEMAFNVYDPLNTAGSLILDQNPLALDFQKVKGIKVAGSVFHRSRAITILNENPLYIEYTTSAFGYVGRSTYQRALFPLKSFIQSMITDDMVTRKAGLLIAMIKQAGSIIDQVMAAVTGFKRALLQEGATNNVLSIGENDSIESLNLQNIDGASSQARKNVLENIATAADMPAKLLNSETFAEGFGEGTEDAKHVARYIDRVRIQMDPLYRFFDDIVMRRAWNPDFYAAIQEKFPEVYKKMPYEQAFLRWKNSFTALWPSLLVEPESEQVKVEDVKLKAVIALLEVLMPNLDPENKAALIEWAADNFNQLELMFQSPLVLDYEAIAEFEPPQPMAAGGEGGEQVKPAPPFSARDSYDAAVRTLTEKSPRNIRAARQAAVAMTGRKR